MLEYNKTVTSQRKWMLYLLAMFVLGAGFTPYTEVFYGLILGSAVSFYNLWLLQRKVKAFEQAMKEERGASSLGTLSRIVMAIITILIAKKYEGVIQIHAVVIGLVSSYFIMAIDYFIRAVIETKNS